MFEIAFSVPVDVTIEPLIVIIFRPLNKTKSSPSSSNLLVCYYVQLASFLIYPKRTDFKYGLNIIISINVMAY